eukprot:snap_masked-scaffold_11-processed-gene-3.27-mRNA-1 protein AED:0.19 eAED:0.19 QI:0/-1/0/1/-1/1/1/0/229
MTGRNKRGEFRCFVNGCAEEFLNASDLRRHRVLHKAERFRCLKCRKTFGEKSKLLRHMEVHKAEKPYECPKCGKKFGYKANVKSHDRTHTGEKPFACRFPGCQKRFTQDSNRKSHEKTHERKRKREVRQQMLDLGNSSSEHRPDDLHPPSVLRNERPQVHVDDCTDTTGRVEFSPKKLKAFRSKGQRKSLGNLSLGSFAADFFNATIPDDLEAQVAETQKLNLDIALPY